MSLSKQYAPSVAEGLQKGSIRGRMINTPTCGLSRVSWRHTVGGDGVGFGDRLQEALIDLICRERRVVTHTELGKLVARHAGARKPVSQPNVSRWFQGSEPKRDAWRVALAAVLGVRREWLFSGQAPKVDEAALVSQPAQPPKIRRARGAAVPEKKRQEREA